jgi:hypothetical protein
MISFGNKLARLLEFRLQFCDKNSIKCRPVAGEFGSSFIGGVPVCTLFIAENITK